MNEQTDLNRFLHAQEGVWHVAMTELRAGRKQTHWMWFVFPQIRGLGTSQRAVYYGISGRAEAAAYAAHPVLGARLAEGVCAVLESKERNMQSLFGGIDAAKFRSCLTLFEQFEPSAALCASALAALYEGQRDQATIEVLMRLP